MVDRTDSLLARIAEALRAVGAIVDVDAVSEEVVAAWSEPHRSYHDIAHLEACLDLADEFSHLAERPDEVTVALVFHDAVYDSRALDNEARSAAWARDALVADGASSALADRVAALIVATETHDAGDSRDAALLLDIDLSVLGADPEGYARYAEGVRVEYAWVDEAQYGAARVRVLERFLSRERIYLTDEIHDRFEARARQNIAREIALLGEG